MGLVSLLPSSITQGPLGNVVTAIFRPARSIGPFSTQVTIEEHGIDELMITDHPVAQNAAITDHSYNRPPEVVIRCGFSNSSLASLVTDVAGILNLFVNGSVGPLNYKNMLMKSIAVETDKETENVLMVTCHCRGVILVQTQVTSVINSNGTTPTPVDPATTNPVTQTGTQNLNTNANPSLNTGALPITSADVASI